METSGFTEKVVAAAGGAAATVALTGGFHAGGAVAHVVACGWLTGATEGTTFVGCATAVT